MAVKYERNDSCKLCTLTEYLQIRHDKSKYESYDSELGSVFGTKLTTLVPIISPNERKLLPNTSNNSPIRHQI